MARVVSTSIINHRSIFVRLLLIGLYALWFIAVIISTTTGFTPYTNVLSSRRHYYYGSSSTSSLLMSSRGGGGYDKHNPGANRRKKPQDFDNDYSYDDNRNSSNNNNNNNNNDNGNNNDNDNDYKGRNRYSTSGEKKNYNDDDNNSNNGSRGRGGGGGRGRSRSGGQAGRGRSTGGRGRGGGGGRTGRGRDQNQQRSGQYYYEMERPPVPPFTSRPTYYTCRHTYESTLQEELERTCKGVSFSTPHPGLLQLLPASSDAMLLPQQQHQPTYALQTLPNCVIVSAESIKGLANEVMKSLLIQVDNNKTENTKIIIEELSMASQGSLSIHTLVPEMFRGTPESKLRQYNRIQKVGVEIASQLKKVCKAARPERPDDDDDVVTGTDEKWLLQLLLLEPQIIAASFTKCTTTSSSSSNVKTPTTTATTWPNWFLPGGLALVDIDNDNEDDDYGEGQQQQRQRQQQQQQQKSSHRISSYNNNHQINIPSSAYRKLLEAFWYMGDRPPSYNYEYPVIDLGASPGGWTSVLRLMECNVIAVDRSPLDKALMMDKERIEFIQGDAFKYIPPWVEVSNNGRITKLETPILDTWMVSDIIAYPNKIIELIDTWTSNNFVSHLIVTIKFQSNDIPWNDIDSAKQIAIKNNYLVNTVHFFNNKNEITFMAMKQQQNNNNNNNNSTNNKNKNIREESSSSNSNDSNDDSDDVSSSSSLLIGKPMYAPILPKQKQQSKNKNKSTATS